MFNALIRWSLGNKLLIVVATIIFFGTSIYLLMQMPVDVFPEFAPPQVVVQTEAPGLSPEDVEALITFPIESAVNGTPGVKTVRSSSSVGLSTIIIVFEWGTDIYIDRQLINERIQTVQDRFPPGTQPPVMLPVTSAVGWLIKYSLTSDEVSPMELRTISEWTIRPRILAIGGIASVVSIGGEVKQYQVLVDPIKLRAFDITLEQVREATEKSNINVPGGFLYQGGAELIVTGVGRVFSLEDLKNTVVNIHDGGTPITLSQLAEIRLGPEIKRGDGAFMNSPAVIGTISKAYGADTLATTYKVEKALENIKAALPDNVEMNYHVFRQADFIESAIDNLNEAVLQGGIIVIVILFLFLFNFRASFISIIAMPLSILAGIMVIKALGLGINSMTLGGIAVAIGMVVDDAIVDVENVYRRLRINRSLPNPEPVLNVVFKGSSEIRTSIVYATVIIIIAFIPIFLLSGLEGRIFRPLGIAFIASMLSSLLVAVTLTPVLCHLLLTRKEEKEHENELAQAGVSLLQFETKINNAGDAPDTAPSSTAGGNDDYSPGLEKEGALVRFLKKFYERVLNQSLKRFYLVITVSAFLFVTALAMLPFLGRSFLPEFQEGNFIIALNTLPGTSLEESMRLGSIIRGNLGDKSKYPEVVSVSQRAGRSELDEDAQPPNFSEFDLNIEYGERPAEELLESIRRDLKQIPGVAVNIGQFISHRFDEILSGIRAQVAIKIYGPDLQTLRRLGKQVKTIMETVEGVEDLQLEQQIDVPQVIITFDRAKAARHGLNVGTLAEIVETSLNGIALSQVLEGRKTFDLFIRLNEKSRNNIDAVRNMLVDTPTGAKIPLHQVADIRIENRPYFINREKVQRRIVVQNNIAGRDLNSVITEIQDKIDSQLKLPPDYFIEYGGQFESQQRATKVLTIYGIVAILGIFMVLFQAFGNFREAALVMINLPLGLIGCVFAVFFTGGELSVPSLVGFITLFGIATRNGIILVGHYDQLLKEGLSLRDTIIQGSLDRLNPILMTALTTGLALVPLLIGEATGKELERPLAIVLIGGLFTSTLLNLIVIPTIYNKFESRRGKNGQTSMAEA
ncbi:MAG: efflux RND transporter permease subunit [Candidatus Dadabacteria bacterium]|nr:MAG: efflux RND transporter permease subunit [Candidatus Dadabacteria bacterium]